ncbi:MAG: hypothetical protein HY901_34000 [Deltaproteobacteria bacterium]|nr:hypothetical protein [Deltaproteobacteria bacterium]
MSAPSRSPSRVFLLSPARCSGKRAEVLLSARAEFPLARRLRSSADAPLGEVFAFLSGLYFRGKLAYALAFARPPTGLAACSALVITPTRGLLPTSTPVGLPLLREFATVDVDPAERRYRAPVMRDALALRQALGPGEAVLLGSLATGKYLEVLAPCFGDRLLYPRAFLGLGDMSRGALLLRCARRGRELSYSPASAATLSLPDRERYVPQ